MAEIIDDRRPRASGTAVAGLVTGISGAVAFLNQMGNGNGLFGFGGNNNDKINALSNELMKEKSERYTDQKFCELKSDMYNKFDAVNASLCAQSTWNATNTSTITCLTNQINQLTSLLTYGVASDKVISSTTTSTT